MRVRWLRGSPRSARSRAASTVCAWLIVCFAVGILACGGSDSPSEEPSAPRTWTVSLPALDGFGADTIALIEAAYARAQALAATGSGGGQSDAGELAEAQGELGLLLLAHDLRAASEPALLNAINLAPREFRWRYYLGYLYFLVGRPEEARQAFEGALEIERDDVPALLRLAEALLALGREEDARSPLERALALDPDNALAYFTLGTIANSPDEAIFFFEAALDLQPRASVIHNALGLAYRDAGDFEASRLHLGQRGAQLVLRNDPLILELADRRSGSQARLAVAGQLIGQGLFSDAIAVLEALIEEEPENAGAHFNLGVAYAEVGELDLAVRALGETVRLDPRNARASYNLGQIHAALGDYEQALASYEAAVAVDPGYTQAHVGLADSLWRLLRCEDLLSHFRLVLEGSPELVAERIHAAICASEMGDFNAARVWLDEGLAALPDQPQLSEALVRVLAASDDVAVRDGARAVLVAEDLVARLPQPSSLESLAMAYAELGRYDDAVATQREALAVLDPAADSSEFAAKLALFESGEPCRRPFSATLLGQ